ncbi:prepilin-type N-terminal cleavage/methylation domain-containing protein [Photobacterium damselae]|uniref:prepilin-type N-terminal cleavage/methylation domain-containing protein n=1 Tax=Photobacterium damselae TaxID=38293 RepID=UPI000D997336|nr:prepilin-type N-terminal cleavage/methylation domain-containing protein [Photobacterium damselae]SPY31139.1 Pilin [Photobacterium damselae]
MNKQQGFSLIELVIVIIVVGILAATAMPRFLNITEQAKKAAVEGMAGGYATAVISARAQWEAYGRPTMQGVSGAVNSVDYDGSEFLLTKASNQDGVRMGYPYALSIDGSSKPFSAMAPQDCVDLLENLLQNPPRASLDQQSIPSGNNVFLYRCWVQAVKKLAVIIKQHRRKIVVVSRISLQDIILRIHRQPAALK